MDNVKYVNHLGETLNLRSAEIMSSYEALKAFVMSMNNSKLTSEGKTTALPVVCLSLDAANKLINTLEKDSANNKYGKLYINDWYIKVIYQGMTPIMRTSEKVKVELSFYAEDTIFTKETRYELSEAPTMGGKGFMFPFTYPFTFSADSRSVSEVLNKELLDADFEMRIQAVLESIEVTIGSNIYFVDAPLNQGELFVLNTAEKEVYKTKDGVKTNLLGAADDNSYIFSSIKNGSHKVTWSGDFVVVLTVLEHRRTPVWI